MFQTINEEHHIDHWILTDDMLPAINSTAPYHKDLYVNMDLIYQTLIFFFFLMFSFITLQYEVDIMYVYFLSFLVEEEKKSTSKKTYGAMCLS